jgi:hypothetical protein
MTKLKCDACSCAYNNDYNCCIDSIQVGGRKATNKSSTCCDSFAEKSGAMSNSNQRPNPEMVVGCEATNCVYNANHKCDASEICISGDHACKSRETECATFHCK